MHYTHALMIDPSTNLLDNLWPDVCRNPKILKATAKDDDSPNLFQALHGPHRQEFLQAMRVEISELEGQGTWKIMNRDLVPEGAKVLPSTWVFKIKIYPDGR